MDSGSASDCFRPGAGQGYRLLSDWPAPMVRLESAVAAKTVSERRFAASVDGGALAPAHSLPFHKNLLLKFCIDLPLAVRGHRYFMDRPCEAEGRRIATIERFHVVVAAS